MNIKKIVQENKAMVYSAAVAIVAAIAVLLFVKRDVDRFIFIMPIFAGWILFNILMLPDDDEPSEFEKDFGEKKEYKKK